MATRTEKIVDTLRTHIDNSDHEGLVTAAEALIAQYERQVRQINRMVKLSDATAENLMATNQRLSALTENLSRFVPKTVVDRLMDPQERQIGYRDRRELTVFFSDIVGFTAMTEQLEPEQLSTLLGDYFSEMGRLCEKWGGTLDQFIGDAVVIFFGAPESRGSEADARNGVGMALEMQGRLEVLRVKWNDMGLPTPLHVRMGIATGYATVGNFGSDRRMHYTAIGNAVNEASRIQALCTPDNVYICPITYLRVRDFYSTSARENVILRGQQQPVQLYQVNSTQRQSASDLVMGNGDGYRIFVDFDILSDKEVALSLLKRAVRQLENSTGQALNETKTSQNL